MLRMLKVIVIVFHFGDLNLPKNQLFTLLQKIQIELINLKYNFLLALVDK